METLPWLEKFHKCVMPIRKHGGKVARVQTDHA